MKTFIATFAMVLCFTSSVFARVQTAPPKFAMYKCYDIIMRDLFSAGISVTAENIYPNVYRKDRVADYWRLVGGTDVLQLEVRAQGKTVYYHLYEKAPLNFACVPAQSRGLR